jgi:sialate O-acetylesterase
MKPILIQTPRIGAFALASLAAAATFSLLTGSAWSDVKIPAVFTDNMVLQRNQPVPIWGTAEAEEKVTVSFAGQSKSATADAQGAWKVTLDRSQQCAGWRSLDRFWPVEHAVGGEAGQ